jgi:predicted dienelactone hydrolase
MTLRRAFCLLPWVAGLSGCLRRPADAAPAPVRDSGVTDLRWTDPVRQRSLPLRLRLPPGDRPVPLVLFSHGLGGSVEAGTLWAQAWAASGIATLHLQHPGSDRAVFLRGAQAMRAAATGEQLMQRVADVRFVLLELQRRQADEPEFLARLRLTTIGLAGHSFGAHTTLAVAGQRAGRAGALDLSDPRPRAFAAFSPAMPDFPSETAFEAMRRPTLCLTGSLDGDPLAPPGSGDRAARGDWRRAVFDALPAPDKAELWLADADHMTFGGQMLESFGFIERQRPDAARAQAARHRALIAEVSTLWWRAQLLDDAAARRALGQPPAGLGTGDAWRRSG